MDLPAIALPSAERLVALVGVLCVLPSLLMPLSRSVSWRPRNSRDPRRADNAFLPDRPTTSGGTS